MDDYASHLLLTDICRRSVSPRSNEIRYGIWSALPVVARVKPAKITTGI